MAKKWRGPALYHILPCGGVVAGGSADPQNPRPFFCICCGAVITLARASQELEERVSPLKLIASQGIFL